MTLRRIGGVQNYSSFSGIYDLSSNMDFNRSLFEIQNYNLDQNSTKFWSAGETGEASFAFNTQGDRLYFVGTTNDLIQEFKLTEKFNLNTINSYYYNQDKTFSNSEGTFIFGSSGNKLYIANSTNIYQYSCQSPYDHVNITLDTTYVSSTNPSTGIKFKSDGLKMYTSGGYNQYIDTYTLSVAWDLSQSVTYESNSRFKHLYNIYDFWINSAGTKLFVADTFVSIYGITNYNLSTPWDFSTATIPGVDFYDPQIAKGGSSTTADTVFGCTYGDNGNKIYVIRDSGEVTQYNLGTPYRVNNITSYTNKTSAISGGPTSGFNSIKFQTSGADAGKKYWAINNVTDILYEYVLTTAWDISTASYNNKFLNFTEKLVSSSSFIAFETSPRNFSFNGDGTLLYILGSSNDPDNISRFTLSTPWDISTAVHEVEASRISISTDAGMMDVTFGDNGTKFYTIGNTEPSKVVFQYNLTTAWDITSSALGSTADKTFNINTGTSRDTDPRAVKFSSAGTTMFVLGNQNNIVIQYTLSTAWDVSTALYSKQFTIGTTQIALADTPSGLDFSTDGTKMFILGDETTNAVYQYTLSTAWDLGTVTLNNPTAGYTISTDSTPTGIVFGDSGNKMYVVGNTSDTIRQFNLSVAYDINSTITLQSSSIITSIDGDVTGIDFSSDGKIVYLCGNNSNKILAFRLNTAWDISSFKRQRISLSTATSYQGLVVNNNDNYFYYYDSTNEQLRNWQLTVAGSLVDGFNIFSTNLKNLGISLNDFSISNDGSYLLIATTYWLFTVNMSTAYDVSTIKTNYLKLSTPVETLALSDDGSIMYICRSISGNNFLAKYNFTTNYNLETISLQHETRLRKYNDTSTNINFGQLYLSQDNSNLWALTTSGINLIKYEFTNTERLYQGFFDLLGGVVTVTGAAQNIKFSSNGQKLYVMSSTILQQIDLDIGFELKTAVYNSKSFTITRDTTPISFVLSPSESDLFVLGDQNDKIYQYKLNTPGDITTAYTFDYKVLTAQNTDPQSFIFNTDGTIGYGLNNNIIYQYTLSTPWSLLTATYDNKSFAVGTAVSSTTLSSLILMGDDGKSMAVLDRTNTRIYQFYLETPWDISTAWFEKTVSVSSQDLAPAAIYIGPPQTVSGVTAGSKMYIGGTNLATEDRVYEYNLPTPWSVAGASFVQSFNTVSGNITGLFFNPEGTRMICVSDDSNAFRQFTLSTPWNISTAYTYRTAIISGSDSNSSDLVFCKYGDNAGKILYILGDANNRIYQFHLGTAYNLSTLNNSATDITLNGILIPGRKQSSAFTSFTNMPSTDMAYTGLDFNDTGTRVYITDDSNNRIYQLNLDTPWDISTLRGIPFKSFPTANANASGLTWGKDGTSGTMGKRLYVCDEVDDLIYQYDLGTAYSVTTINTSISTVNSVPGYKTLNITTFDSTPYGVEINDDGTKLYITGTGSDRVAELILDTPWDVTSARLPYKVKSVSVQLTTAAAFTFKSDGTKMYVMSSTTSDVVYQYSLSTAWDVSTATYDTKSFTLQTEAAHTGFDITDVYDAGGGIWKQHLYAVGTTNDRIYRYTITTTSSTDAKFWDITQFGTVEATSLLVQPSAEGTQHSIKISRDGADAGKYITLVGQTNDDVYFYNMSTAYDLSTATLVTGTKDVSAEGTPTGVAVAYGSGVTEGTVFYVVGDTSDTIRQYSLKQSGVLTPWASGTIEWNLEYSLSIGSTSLVNITAATDLAVSKNGEWIYVLDASNVYGFPMQVVHQLYSANKGDLYVGGQETIPVSSRFANNGTELYLYGQSGDDINRYTLSVPWLVSSATFISNSAVLSDITPYGLEVTNDGSKFLVVGATDIIREYTPSVNYNTTLTAGITRDIGYFIADPKSLKFSNDGTKLFVITATAIFEFEVDSPYVTNAINTQWYPSSDATPECIKFKSNNVIGGTGNGTKFAVFGSTLNTVRTYTCQYPWNISSVTSSAAGSINLPDVDTKGIAFNVDGSKMYTAGLADIIYELPTSDFESSSATSTSRSVISPTIIDPVGIDINTDGTKMFVLAGGIVYELFTDTAYDPDFIYTTYVAIAEDSAPAGLHIGDNGTKLTYFGSTNDDIRVYSLVSPYNVNNYTSFNLQTTIPDISTVAVWVSDDGTNISMLGQANDKILRYTTSTPWNFSSWSNSGKSYNLIHRLDSDGMCFSYDGLTMYILSGTQVVQVPLETAWCPETAYTGVISVSAEDTAPVSICKTSDGLNLYMLGDTGNDINRYTLSPANKINTATFVNAVVHSTDASATGLTCNETGSTFWIIGPTNDILYQISNSGTNGVLGTLSQITNFSVSAFDATTFGIHYDINDNSLFFTGQTSDAVYKIKLGSQKSLIGAYLREISVSSRSTTWKSFEKSFDGKSLYLSNDNVIFQYTISLDNEITNATYDNKFLYVGSLVGGPAAIKELVFAKDGLKFYFLDNTNDRLQSWKIKSLG